MRKKFNAYLRDCRCRVVPHALSFALFASSLSYELREFSVLVAREFSALVAREFSALGY